MPIITAAPMTDFLGIKDGSIRALQPFATPVPSHLPLIFTYAKKGDDEMTLVNSVSAIKKYGDTIFDVRSKFATHQTVLAEIVNRAGNAIMFKRIIPADAPPAANVRICAEVVRTKVNPLKRDDTGNLLLSSTGQTQNADATVVGYQVKFVAEYIDTTGNSAFGQGKVKTGTMTGTAGEESRRYPIFDFEVSSQGAWGNLQGIRMWSPNVNSAYPLNENAMRSQNAYPIFLAFIEKETPDATGRFIYSDNGERFVQTTLNPEAYDANTDMDYYIGTDSLNRWAIPSELDTFKPVGPFSKLHVYQDNIDTLLAQFVEAEKAQLAAYPNMNHDLDADRDDDMYRFNFLGGETSQGIQYLSYKIIDRTSVSSERLVRFSPSSNIMATGGGDGTMSKEAFSAAVVEQMRAFRDKNSKYLDLIRYPISVFYDTGFNMAAKRAIADFLAIRKDVVLLECTSVEGEREPTAIEESSIATALRTHMQAHPESTYYGTEVVRGAVIAHTGRILNSRHRRRVPAIFDVAYKMARYMGASNGIWKSEFSPDVFPNNRVDTMGELSESYKPADVRNRDWKTGMCWADACDINDFYWPAFRTVYDNDTSILTSLLTAFGFAEMEKIGERVRVEFSGTTKLTNAQLAERIEKRFLELCSGRFDNRFDITPMVRFTRSDIARGYSWTLFVEVRANNMKTAQTLSFEALRRDENDVPTTNIDI